ncbi:TetR/AcrR family transcriptional regulator [Nitriliruptoraceae bacterium ZYF776]|nr:TetR/AcrR family transcriptional regulator [Profundirhabdus halotolerans]
MSKRVRMTAQERREQLVGVARSLFAERGFEATSVEEIAERAGVSKPVVYQHFGGKEGIYAVVVDREVRHLTTSITRSFDAEVPRLVAVGAAEAFLTYIEEHEEGFRVLVRDAPTPMTGGSFATVIADVAARCERLLIDEFHDRGFDETTAPMYARMLVGAVALVGEWWLDVREPPREVVAAHVVNLLWNGLHDLAPVPGDAKGLEKLAKRQRRTREKEAKREEKLAEKRAREDAEVAEVDAAPAPAPRRSGEPKDAAALAVEVGAADAEPAS